MIYVCSVGNKYKIQPFKGYKELRLDHKKIITGKVLFINPRQLMIVTSLSYFNGQKVSIGGYPIGGKWFSLQELSITDKPLLEGAEILERI